MDWPLDGWAYMPGVENLTEVHGSAGGRTVFRTDVDSNDQSPRVNIRVRVGDGDTTPKKPLRIYVRSENRPAPY